MKISVEYTKEKDAPLKINTAKYLADYVIRIQFNDGSEKLVDFKSFLMNASHPSIRKYLDEAVFSDFKIIDGNLNWSDYELIFPISDLYNNKIDSSPDFEYQHKVSK